MLRCCNNKFIGCSEGKWWGKWRPVLAILLLAYSVFLFFPTLLETAKICWEDEDYSHGLLLPFISGYLLWQRRASLPLNRQRETALSNSGLSLFFASLLLTLGLSLLYLGELSNLHFFRWLGFFPATLGLAQLLFGYRQISPFIGPFLLNFMAKPLPDSLVPKLFFPLQVFSAKVSALCLELFNVPFYLRGNIIEIPGMQLMVEEACSGLRSLMALITVAFIVAYSLELKSLGRVLLILSAVALAIILNTFRVAATGLLAHFVSHESASGFFHTFSGMLVFILGLFILQGLGQLVQKFFRADLSC